MTHTYAQAGRSSSILATLRGLVAAWRESVEQRRIFERTYEELSSLSDRELADIGVSRSQIIDLSWASARRD